MYNVYQFKALDTFVVDTTWMQEQLDNTVTNSSCSSSQKAEPPFQSHTGIAMDLNSQLLCCSLTSSPKYSLWSRKYHGMQCAQNGTMAFACLVQCLLFHLEYWIPSLFLLGPRVYDLKIGQKKQIFTYLNFIVFLTQQYVERYFYMNSIYICGYRI